MAHKNAKDEGRALGPLLCWAVVYADIGTSVYYVPGILFGHVGPMASSFVLMTSIAFIFLGTKYAQIAGRYAEGGGVVTVSTEAFGRFFGCLGGMLIIVDYFLTSSISAVSGMNYLASVTGLSKNEIVLLASLAILMLGIINTIGIKESAMVSATFALTALAVNVLVVGVVSWQLSADDWDLILSHMLAGGRVPVKEMLIGYSAAWLAFSGLESISQLSPAMRTPRSRVAGVAMTLVIVSVLVTSPLLTAFSTVLGQVDKHEAERFISALAASFSRGQALQLAVVISASALLVLAANTAIIGCYHVFLALARQGFLPGAVSKRHPRLGTPVVAIGVATVVPVVIVLLTQADMGRLGELYAFGLLGAFTLTSISFDVILWREQRRGLMTLLGILTTFLVVSAWVTNLIVKWQATLFGGGVTLVGLGIAYSVQRGWLSAATRGYLTAEEAERVAAQLPGATQLMILEEALDLQSLNRASMLVALRGKNPKLVREAINRARGRGERTMYVLVVDEVPGLLYPPDAGPSEDAIDVLSHTVAMLQAEGIEALPIWRMAHDAGRSIASAATRLGVDCVVVGTTHRTAIWHLLRGNVLKELISRLPEKTSVLIVN